MNDKLYDQMKDLPSTGDVRDLDLKIESLEAKIAELRGINILKNAEIKILKKQSLLKDSDIEKLKEVIESEDPVGECIQSMNRKIEKLKEDGIRKNNNLHATRKARDEYKAKNAEIREKLNREHQEKIDSLKGEIRRELSLECKVEIEDLTAQLKKAKSRAPEFSPRQHVMVNGHPAIKGECVVTEIVITARQQQYFVLPTDCTKKGVSGYAVDASMMTAKHKPKTK